MEGIEGVFVGSWMIRAELSHESLGLLSTALILVRRSRAKRGQVTYGIRENAAEARRVETEEHIAYQKAEAGEQKHRGHQ